MTRVASGGTGTPAYFSRILALCERLWFAQMPALMIALVLSVWIYQMLYESRWREALRFSPVRVAMAASMILYMGVCSTGGKAFIYFQF